MMNSKMLGILVLLTSVGLSHQKDLHYYIAAVEAEWNYAPSGRNGITGEEFSPESFEAKYVIGGADRIGSTYKKAVYREYTDDTFTTQKPHPEWLGTLGPVLRAEVRDIFHIHFKNLASKPYTVHPHGVFYDKRSEGALYEDNTRGQDKKDDGVEPGDTHIYTWEVPMRAGPSAGDTGCVSWQYHSHIESPLGTNTGLVGPMVICRQGFLRADGSRVDVDREFFLLITTEDENLSYYLEENIQTYCTDPDSVDPEDEDFLESNKMRSINNYVYGNLPGLEVCVGDRVAWHIFGMGTEIDVHTLTFTGNELFQNNHRKDVYSLSPAAIFNTEMRPRNTGTWLITSNVITHVEAGLQALYTVRDDCGWRAVERPLQGQLREYFIAAVEDLWNYAPSGISKADGSSLTNPEKTQSVFFENSTERIGGSYQKYLFREFTDDTFTTRKERSADEQYLGILGPVIRAEVGDTIKVHFKNMVSHPVSIHPSGVVYDKTNEGMKYNDGTSESEKADDEIAPGSTYIYEWTVPEHVGPTDTDAQCLTNIYRSVVDPIKDFYSGLIGPLLVCKEGSLDEDGKQMNVDGEFILLFSRFDENQSWLIDANIEEFSPEADTEDEDFIASNLMEAVNGWSYSNIPNLDMCVGDTISWHLVGFGGETDHNTIYFHESSFTYHGRRLDSFPLLPGISGTIHMVVENEGLLAIDSLTIDHYVNGMQALYNVSGCEEEPVTVDPNPTRTYYIAAVEMEWNYTPIRYDPIRSQSLDEGDSEGHVFVKQGDTFIGSTYKKALFREFTDDSFQDQKPREEHWGFLGPPIYIEVGETVEIVFKNLASIPYSIHSHGVSTRNGEDISSVDPGETHTYYWSLPPSKAPLPKESRCLPYVYHSAASFEHDLFSGLVGPLLACKRGSLQDGRRRDIDEELFLFFMVSDENKSWYLDDNIGAYCSNSTAVDKSDAEFEESNLMHGINGFIYSNLQGLEMMKGDKVEWYLISMGNEVDLHSVHFHGQTIVYRTEQPHRADVFELFPGVSSALRMLPDNPGEWLLHCHVNDHILGGMETTFIVRDSSQSGERSSEERGGRGHNSRHGQGQGQRRGHGQRSRRHSTNQGSK